MSGGGVKALVGGLTGLVNAVMRRDDEVPVEMEARPAISVKALRDGIEGDYQRCYLWTGDIDPDLYDWDCAFTGVPPRLAQCRLVASLTLCLISDVF